MHIARVFALTTGILMLIPVFPVRANDGTETQPDAHEMRTVASLRTPDMPVRPRIWVTPEYVHYWQSSTPKLPQLLSIADPTDTFPVGNYYGDRGLTWSDGNGVKLTVGGWIDSKEQYGAELTGFYIPRQTQSMNYDPLPGNVDAFFTDYHFGVPPFTYRNFFPSDPASYAHFQYSTQQYGGEANGLIRVHDWEPFDGAKLTGTGLIGFRYFGLQDTYSDQYGEPTIGFFYNDYFKTNNNFYGANIGAHLRIEYKRFFAEVTPKIALGVTEESVQVSGSNLVPVLPFNDGFYASGNKVGDHTRDTFAYLPQITVKIGYDFNETVEAFVGYDALYLSDVARVENQISTQLDGHQIAGSGAHGAPDASPPLQVQSNSLFEQGVTAGITLKL